MSDIRLIELKCPNCGAALRVNEQLQNCMCNFCGHTFLIYDGSNRNRPEKKNEIVRGKRTIVLPTGVPQEYINALLSAYSYSDSCHLSKRGLYEQLSDDEGAGFPPEAAQFAIDHADIDYKENALAKAKSYFYGEFLHLSRRDVYDQLTDEEGEMFTEEEARYAMDHLED